MQKNSWRQIRREINGGKLGEKVGKKVRKKVGEKTAEKVGESLGEIDKLNLCRNYEKRLDKIYNISYLRI